MTRNNTLVIRLYDQLARYSKLDIIASGRYVSSSLFYIPYLANDIARLLDLQPGDRLLDLGCNVGIYHPRLARRVSQIVGVDAGATIIERARRENARLSNVSYVQLDLLTSDWDTVLMGAGVDIAQPFDKVLCYAVIHFFDDLEDVRHLLHQVKRLIKPGGKLLLGEVRETALYEAFRSRGSSGRWRDLRFRLNKRFSALLLRHMPKEQAGRCQPFSYDELASAIESVGGHFDVFRQKPRHPFYNTCVDYVITF